MTSILDSRRIKILTANSQKAIVRKEREKKIIIWTRFSRIFKEKNRNYSEEKREIKENHSGGKHVVNR